MKFEKFFNCFYLGEMKLFLKGGENKVFFFNYFFIWYLLLLHICYLLFICLYFRPCSDVLFWVFQERQVHSDQDLLSLIVTCRLGVLDWDLWCNWAYYCNWVVLVFEHVIFYISFVTDCQRGRLLGSKSLEQLANHDLKLV